MISRVGEASRRDGCRFTGLVYIASASYGVTLIVGEGGNLSVVFFLAYWEEIYTSLLVPFISSKITTTSLGFCYFLDDIYDLIIFLLFIGR